MIPRIIAKLDVKSEYVVKPIHFEGLRKVGEPSEMLIKYCAEGADELFYVDIVASLYRRGFDVNQIRTCSEEIYVPFAVGGGVRTLDDFSLLFHNGADKVVINTHALQEEPEIIDKAAHVFGSQAVVVNIEAKEWDGYWECYSDCGRIRSDIKVLNWVKEVESRGAGEIFLQSVDKDGRQKGFDIPLIGEVVNSVKIPVVASSGAGNLEHILNMFKQCQPSGISLASTLHYNKLSIKEVKAAIEGVL